VIDSQNTFRLKVDIHSLDYFYTISCTVTRLK